MRLKNRDVVIKQSIGHFAPPLVIRLIKKLGLIRVNSKFTICHFFKYSITTIVKYIILQKKVKEIILISYR